MDIEDQTIQNFWQLMKDLDLHEFNCIYLANYLKRVQKLKRKDEGSSKIEKIEGGMSSIEQRVLEELEIIKEQQITGLELYVSFRALCTWKEYFGISSKESYFFARSNQEMLQIVRHKKKKNPKRKG